jgi:hypothetical protein
VSRVLAIEPDIRQGGILTHIVRELVCADLVLVESRDAAIAAITQQIPDVILVTALLSPRDEDELIGHLRRLDGAEHLQTHTIPLLAGARGEDQQQKGGGLFGKFRKKKEPEPLGGCDPEVFAQEIRTFLARAAELKVEGVAAVQRAEVELEEDLAYANARHVHDTEPAARPERKSAFAREPEPSSRRHSEPQATTPAAESTWSSPFEWKSSYGASSHPASAPDPNLSEPFGGYEAAKDGDARQDGSDGRTEFARPRAEDLQREAEEDTRRESEEDLRREAEEHRLEAERLRAEAEAAAERALHESLRRQEAEAEAEAAERERQEDMRLLRAEAAEAAARAREHERALLAAEAATAVAVERAREEERGRLEIAAAKAAEQARAEERRRVEAEAAAAAARAREDERSEERRVGTE